MKKKVRKKKKERKKEAEKMLPGLSNWIAPVNFDLFWEVLEFQIFSDFRNWTTNHCQKRIRNQKNLKIINNH